MDQPAAAKPEWRPEWKRKKDKGRPKSERQRKAAPAAPSASRYDLPECDNPRVFELAGLGLPLVDVAASAGVDLEDLQEGGRLNGDVRRGIAWANEQVARVAFDKAREPNGNPIPMLFFAKCRLGWRETGERETEVKKERQIEEVQFRLIRGGGNASSAPKSPADTAGGSEEAGDSGEKPGA